MSPSRVDGMSPLANRGRDPEELLTVAQVALETKQSELTVRRHIEKGALEVMRINGHTVRIQRAALWRYMGRRVE
jgi:excisionase family DNA binding protein